MYPLILGIAVLFAVEALAMETDAGPFEHHAASAEAAVAAPAASPVPPPGAPLPPGAGAATTGDAPPRVTDNRFGGGSDPGDLPLARDGVCPPAPAIPADCNFRCKSLFLKSAAPRRIILRQAPVYEDLDLKRPLTGQALVFGNPVWVSHWEQGPVGTHFVRFNTDLGPRCGWIEGSAVLPVGRGPLRISDLNAAGIADFRLRGKGSSLDAKVLVLHYYREGYPRLCRGARVYYRFDDPEPYNTIKTFNVLDVYDDATHDGQVWYFVGNTRGTRDRGEEQVLYGWVKATEVVPWSTQISLYPAPGRTGLRFYETDGDAQAQANPMATQADDGWPTDRVFPGFPLVETIRVPAATIHEIALPERNCGSNSQCVTNAILARPPICDAPLKDFCDCDQWVDRAFVHQPSGKDPDWSYWLSIKPNDMAKIVDASENLCDTLSADDPELDSIREAMAAVLKGVTGDSPEEAGDPDETLRVFLAKSTQVPVEQFAELLNKNIDGFVDWYLNSTTAHKEPYMALMCKKSALLKLAANGQRVEHDLDDLEFNPGTRSWRPRAGTTKPFNWLWQSEQGAGFYYIPLTYVL